MRNFIILEGPDCAGKSTLANKLKERGYRIEHFGPNLESSGEDMVKMYLYHMSKLFSCYQNGHKLQSPSHIVFDRSWISELSYGPIHRGKSRFSIRQLNFLYDVAEFTQPVIVYCRPSKETILSTFQSRIEEEMLDSVGQLQDVISYYDLFMNELVKKNRFHIINYDYELQQIDKFCDHLINLKAY